MKQKRNKTKRTGFTIVELLTVMSIIVILIGLLVPALSQVRRYALKVKQKAQFHSMEAALELFNNEYDGYPPSDALDPTGQPYCGAMKLAEALMGWDLLGFHKHSIFRRDGMGSSGQPLYTQNLKDRVSGPLLPLEQANAYKIGDIYGPGNVNQFLPDNYVLCDVYEKQRPDSDKTGMPILYYKADTSGFRHDPNVAQQMTPDDNAGNIYNYLDNQMLLMLGFPGQTGGGGTQTNRHGLAEPANPDYGFYAITRTDKIKTPARPFRADTYLLISAGYDGEYGTADDICNFDAKISQ